MCRTAGAVLGRHTRVPVFFLLEKLDILELELNCLFVVVLFPFGRIFPNAQKVVEHNHGPKVTSATSEMAIRIQC